MIGNKPKKKQPRRVPQPNDGEHLVCTRCEVKQTYECFYLFKPPAAGTDTYGGYIMPCRLCSKEKADIKRDKLRLRRAESGWKRKPKWRKVIQPGDGSTLICTECRVQKPYDCFYAATPGSASEKTWYGYVIPCKSCSNARSAKRVRTESDAERDRLRQSTEKFKIARRAALANRLATDAEYAERCRLYRRQRKAALAGDPGSITIKDWHKVIEAYGSGCIYCGSICEKISTDHVIPVSKGGRHTIDNVVPACLRCNQRKNALSVADFLNRNKLGNEFYKRRESGLRLLLGDRLGKLHTVG